MSKPHVLTNVGVSGTCARALPSAADVNTHAGGRVGPAWTESAASSHCP